MGQSVKAWTHARGRPRLRSAPGPDSSLSSSPAIKSYVLKHEREGENAESAEGRSSPKLRRIEPTDPRSTVPPSLQEHPWPEDTKTPPATPRRKIGIHHIGLSWYTRLLGARYNVGYVCEIDPPTTCVVGFPLSAAYTDLVDGWPL
ncbi:hypothetical protein EI94DRAFT_1706561 [Lactarius quietus]|nr:hypothetical protein EI94DRAFT_1706561 [Lactarius quietus]